MNSTSNLFKKFFLGKNSFTNSKKPVIYLLYPQKFNVNFEHILTEIEEIEPISQAVRWLEEQNWSNSPVLLASVSFDNHVIEIAGLPAALPTIILEQCVYPTGWQTEFKELLQAAQANILLHYAGQSTDAIEQYLALYKVAHCLTLDAQCLGVVNEPAATCHPAGVIQHILDFNLLSVARHSPPLPFWTGFQKVEWQNELYFLTRGFHLFNIPDFIALAWDESRAEDLQNLFFEIFQYIYFEKKELLPGDGIYIEDYYAYQFNALPQDFASALGEQTFLLVEPLDTEAWESEGLAENE